MSCEILPCRTLRVEPRGTPRCATVARNWKIATTARSRTTSPHLSVVQHWNTLPPKMLACRWKNSTSIKGTGAPPIRANSFSSATIQTPAKAEKPEPPDFAILATQIWGHVSKIISFPYMCTQKPMNDTAGFAMETTNRLVQHQSSTSSSSSRGCNSTALNRVDQNTSKQFGVQPPRVLLLLIII